MRLLKILTPILGILFLSYLLHRLGPGLVWRHLAVLGWRFPLILLLAGAWHIANSIAWRFAFSPGACHPRLPTLLMAKLAGDAVSQLTPLANLGGEPLKAYLLRGESPASQGLASVVINKTAQIATGLAFTIIGVGLIFFYWPLPRAIPLSIKTGLGWLVLIGVLLIWLLWHKQQRLFSSLLALMSRLGVRPAVLEQRQTKAERIDHRISQFYHHHKARFALVLSFHSLSWLLGACETFAILRFLGVQVEFPAAFLIAALTVIINSLFFFMPSNIGAMEGGQVFLLATLGLDPALGLSLGIIKRMRKLFWVLIGWILLTQLSREAMPWQRTARWSASRTPASNPVLEKNQASYR